MSTLHSCILCGEDMPEVPGAQVCESCDHPGLQRLYLPEQGEWILWEERPFDFDNLRVVES